MTAGVFFMRYNLKCISHDMLFSSLLYTAKPQHIRTRKVMNNSSHILSQT